MRGYLRGKTRLYSALFFVGPRARVRWQQKKISFLARARVLVRKLCLCLLTGNGWQNVAHCHLCQHRTTLAGARLETPIDSSAALTEAITDDLQDALTVGVMKSPVDSSQ